jgi:hypothetical protein
MRAEGFIPSAGRINSLDLLSRGDKPLGSLFCSQETIIADLRDKSATISLGGLSHRREA